uniref:Ran GTPase-activating protein 1-like n=1 Tax=Phallusia mammillata TaxID=59560 RepID=A0A6F9DR09_9ASCI|nr:ran GTPase-activating protein 1-like [Phallusia mammillata]
MDVNKVADLLAQTTVNKQNKISFKGEGRKLDKAEDAAEIIKAIVDCPDLEVLELVGNTVGVDCAKLIADTLHKRPELQRCLWADMFTGRLRSEIPISLTSLGNAIIEANAHLVELDLSDNAFGPDCAKACVPLLKSPACYTLQELRFNNNGLGGGGIILADTLIECHKKSSATGKPLQLKVFVAGRNRLENPGAKALADAFKTIGTLEEIQLPQNGIQHQGIVALAEAVKCSPNLRHLNLNDNIFTEKGAVPMANALKHIDSLEIVNFGDCLIRTEGAKALGQNLAESNPNLKELILSFGEVQLEGGIAVCEAMTGKLMLQKLDLNGNQFGDDGVDEIKDLGKEFTCKDALGSLSDDEGVDSDEESGSDHEADETNESIENIVNGTHDESVQNGYTGTLEEITPKNFFSVVSAAHLLQLSASQRAELMEEVIEFVPNAEAAADAFLTLSNLLTEDCVSNILSCEKPSAENLRVSVFECIDVLMAEAFDKYPNTPMLVINPLLVRMGLIKSEDKKFKSPSDIRAQAVVLGHICQQAYFPQFVKKIIRGVVTKDSEPWEISPILRSQLLQLLFA